MSVAPGPQPRPGPASEHEALYQACLGSRTDSSGATVWFCRCCAPTATPWTSKYKASVQRHIKGQHGAKPAEETGDQLESEGSEYMWVDGQRGEWGGLESGAGVGAGGGEHFDSGDDGGYMDAGGAADGAGDGSDGSRAHGSQYDDLGADLGCGFGVTRQQHGGATSR